jgi:nitrite reductase/ring-hydroxylating ferredoxin subunit/uncharacterized membrane protein
LDPRNLGERLESNQALDALADPLRRIAEVALPSGPMKDLLHGVWLGHPLHPLLTDLPIGFWTSSWALDIVGGPRSAKAAEQLVGLGVASALPTAVAGLADWSELNKPERRSGAVHAVANLTATALYTASYIARRRGRRGRGIALGMAGAAAATAGGFLGGHLSFRRAAGVNHITAADSPTEWVDLEGEVPTAEDTVGSGRIEATRVATATVEGTAHAMAATCSHLGGPLDEGDIVERCIRCPWHGSEFRLTDGTVARGPATAPQPAYEVRRDDTGRLQGRRKPLP